VKLTLFLVIGLIFGIVIVGLASLQRDVMILAIPLMVYLFAAIFQHPDEVKLLVTREISPDYAPQGTPITVKLTVFNEGAAIDELTLRDILPEGVRKIDGKLAATSFLDSQDKIELEYTIEARRGEYRTYETHVYARDFLNFFETRCVYRTSPRLLIHPRYPKLNRIKIRPPQTRGFAGPIAARQGGTGIDFWAVREYQSGDPQRQINWKLASYPDKQLYTNIFEQERVADVGIILDSRERVNVITPHGSLFEYGVRAAASLAENFLDDGNRVSLLIFGSGLGRVFPGYGRFQRDRILRALSRARPEVNFALESLTSLPTRFFPAKSQIVMVSPLIPEDAPVIALMRSHGYYVIIISPDPISYEAGMYDDFASDAYRLAHAERTLMLNQIRHTGAQIVNWRVDQPLEMVIGTALTRQPPALHHKL
jgi:uncharacterized protein (DUF58 family)